MARGMLGILDALNDTVAFERPQPARQDVAGGAGIAGYLVETMNAQGHLPKRQQRPPLAQYLKPGCDEARPGRIPGRIGRCHDVPAFVDFSKSTC